MKFEAKNKNHLMFVIVMMALGYVSYLFYEFTNEDVPKLEAERQVKQTELSNKQAELLRLQEFAKNIQRIKSEFRELNVQLESALDHMPRSYNMPQLLRRLNLLAQNSGVEMNAFKPSKDETKKEGGFYSSANIDVYVRGTFTQTMVFLDQIARLKRIVSIDKISIAVSKDNAQRSGALVADTMATLKTYRFTE